MRNRIMAFGVLTMALVPDPPWRKRGRGNGDGRCTPGCGDLEDS